ncbi:next to BRCA1 gene 1 protein [Chaetomidium leptoderma]|uniref:Next to BRCA1 gene 1 protein n=1 Tax=Chaetomidium leptoderma TaxID=669021 RepID=A0AAN6ZVU6_9PEZI|nr:next to BRCA1 gene 1 protein [Chaetomidium leptoderma]
MASVATPDTPVTLKVNIDGSARRFKLPLRDVGVNVLESKLRTALNIPADAEALIERYSDSAAAYIVLDQANTAVYKQLYRAAKAKLKLKLRVTVKGNEPEEDEKKQGPQPASVTDEAEEESHPSVEPTDTEREPEQPEQPAASNSTPATEPVKAETVEAEPVKDEPVKAEPALLLPASVPAPAPVVYADALNLGSLRSMMDKWEDTLAVPKEITLPAQPTTPPAAATLPCAVGCPAIRANYAVCCNSCDRTIPDAHYHCSTCDDGDFDLCQDCVDRGVTCKGPNHWLIKRFVKSGVIINSTTERLAPKPKPSPKPQPKQAPSVVPAAPERIIPVFNDFLYSSIRTCNCCVQEFPEAEFVHCTTCDDYDLCRACFAKNRHGHHPKHAFVPAVEGARLSSEVTHRLTAGRGQAHNAICDGCDKGIKGIRHKCLDCPDWDYCSGCVVNAGFIHPGHRFVPMYEPLEYDGGARLCTMNRPVHFGICCDGPLCSSARTNSSYVVGDRFKCAVCHDTDFCASCEASPANTHNRTHPLIKFKSPVRHVSVTTTGENQNGRLMPTMGDRPRSRPASEDTQTAETSTPPSLLSGVQTVVDVKPSEPVKVEKKIEEKPVRVKVKAPEEKPLAAAAKPFSTNDLHASFVRDTVPDGTVFGPDHVFEQTWILRNDGDVAWPAGCSVKFVGGDYMGHLDSNHPAATRDVEFSCESTICYASIQPGEEFPFTVLLRSPRRSGRVVSNWRLTTKEGDRFGHRLWCDVVVEKPKVVLPPPSVAEPEKQQEEKKEAAKPKYEVLEQSQMIFPKLEKESPVASVHEETRAESVSAQEDEYEDCEDDEWNEGESEEGFLTDEEYDILDASDEEFHLDSPSKQK